MTQDLFEFIRDKYGWCYYAIEESEAMIYNLYVHPKYRNKGHARRLIRFVINQIRESGYTDKIKIEAIPMEENIDKQRLSLFYTRLGLDVM